MRLTSNQALERLMSTGMRKAKGKPLQLAQRVKSYRKDRLFVFEREGTAIVTPADDTIQPIVAEFDYELGCINPTAQLVLNDYAKEVKAIQEGEFDEPWTTPTAEPTDYIAPLMPEIMWHQHRPFNDNLDFVEVVPTKGLVERCLVGCTSTAVAQLVYYLGKRGWKRGCVATPPYTSQLIHGCQFEVTPEAARTSFDFANMLDNYTKRKGSQYVNVVSYTEEQGKAAWKTNSTLAMSRYTSKGARLTHRARSILTRCVKALPKVCPSLSADTRERQVLQVGIASSAKATDQVTIHTTSTGDGVLDTTMGGSRWTT